MAVMNFLAGLPSEFEAAKSQILSCGEITPLQDAFSIPKNMILVTKGGNHDFVRERTRRGRGN
ncbi:hypothetical protein PVK06_046817 [Gossypium arboreum]|uniref:Uncharacterized protein n=1 Tax=Gossypium arboreum TaxID=29729 RepID=A0ABR0MBM9_GOSAR|nr:hypothetical protein PVK06_046817 [Gossypium arboreum]